jgi:hypothetical protein
MHAVAIGYKNNEPLHKKQNYFATRIRKSKASGQKRCLKERKAMKNKGHNPQDNREL